MRDLTGEQRLAQLRAKLNIRLSRNIRKFMADEIDILPEANLNALVIEEFERLRAEMRRMAEMTGLG